MRFSRIHRDHYLWKNSLEHDFPTLILSMMNIPHERIHPATPKEDAHIESFNSILEREVIRRFEFESFEEAQSTVGRFVDFYNNERLHTAIGYITPREMNKKCMEESQKA